MATAVTPIAGAVIDYPESDGQPMAENTLQFDWIVTIKENLDSLLPEAFVAGDLFWYPVEGSNLINQAPDVLVALGRPKGHRGSYKQWEEGNVAPQVVFEIRSPSNRAADLRQKEEFYASYGVLEYYLYDPEANVLQGWQRQAGQWQSLGALASWVSPLLGIRFVVTPETLEIYRADGRRFETVAELRQRAEAEHQAKEVALAQVAQAQQEAAAALAQTAQAQQEATAALAQTAQAQQEAAAALAQTAQAQQEAAAALAQAAQAQQTNATLRAELERLQRHLAAANVSPPVAEPGPEDGGDGAP